MQRSKGLLAYWPPPTFQRRERRFVLDFSLQEKKKKPLAIQCFILTYEALNVLKFGFQSPTFDNILIFVILSIFVNKMIVKYQISV
jgi:hypothetical protein